MRNHPIIISGLPRSGTTWVGEIMSQADNTNYVFEPDNEKINAYAWLYKYETHRFPYYTKTDTNKNFERMWKAAFTGKLNTKFDKQLFTLFLKSKVNNIESNIGQNTGYNYIDTNMRNISKDSWKWHLTPSKNFTKSFIAKLPVNKPHLGPKNKQTIVKSVHSILCLDWLASIFSPKVVIVLRNPYALYASYLRLKMPDGFRNILYQEPLRNKVEQEWQIDCGPSDGIEGEIAFQIAVTYRLISNQLNDQLKRKNAPWTFVSHDRFCLHPIESYQQLFNQHELKWTSKVEQKIIESNKSGTGFEAKRVSKDQPTKWKNELSKKEIDAINYWIEKLQVSDFIEDNIL